MKCNKSSFARAIWAMLALGLYTVWFSCVRADELLAPQLVIQKTADQLQLSLQKPELKKDFKKAVDTVDTIIQPHIDFERVSTLILGKYWRQASSDQKDRFKREFRLLLVRTYATAFTEYANWKIRYLPLDMTAQDHKVTVRTEILQSGAQPVAVNYRMIESDKDWKVYDVLIEGISLLQNYRSSFTEEIARDGSLDNLISHLAERNASAMKEPVGGTSADDRAGS